MTHKNILIQVFIVSTVLSSLSSCKTKNKSNSTNPTLITAEIKSLFNNQKESNNRIEDSIILSTPNETSSAYQERNYEPYWINAEGLTNNGKSLINFVINARNYGLIPEAYNVQKTTNQYNNLKIDTLWENARKNPKNWARMDILLTDAFLSISRNLDLGYIPLDSLSKDKSYISSKYRKALVEILDADNLIQILESFEPSTPSYKELKKHLPAFLSNTDFSKKLTFIDYPIKNQDKFINQIIKRSKEENFLAQDVTTLDSVQLSTLIKKIQEKKNLEIDGKYGRQVIFALNNTDQEKYFKIVINMDRL
jgi:murein L,D-transpeptidase YcbB/YkuD